MKVDFLGHMRSAQWRRGYRGLGADSLSTRRSSRPRLLPGRPPMVPLRCTIGYRNPRFHR